MNKVQMCPLQQSSKHWSWELEITKSRDRDVRCKNSGWGQLSLPEVTSYENKYGCYAQ